MPAGFVVPEAGLGPAARGLHRSLDGVPASVDTEAVEHWLRGLPGVADLHDLHVWSLSTSRVALTVHLVMPGGCPDDGFLNHIAEELAEDFCIGYVNIQVERADGPVCRLFDAAGA